MKILLLGDASNYHTALGKALAEMGHDVTVASSGSGWMNTSRTIDLSRPVKGKLGGMLLYANILYNSKKLQGYDVVQIHNPVFLELRPERVRKVFDIVKRENGAVFLTALGTDTPYVKMCLDPASPLRYNEWTVNGEETMFAKTSRGVLEAWQSAPLAPHCDYIYSNIDGAVSALYEYDLAVRRVLPGDMVAYGGIPVDTRSIEPAAITEVPEKVKFFLGRHNYRKIEKGTDRFETQARRVVERYPDRCSLEIVENLPYSQYLTRLRNAHVVLDQLYSYTPATNALLAMAMGLNTVSGGESDYYDFIGEKSLRPIINTVPDDDKLYETLVETALHPEKILQRGIDGRKFVERHNDSHVVAQRFVDFWTKRLNTK